jgi:hypothetical protein
MLVGTPRRYFAPGIRSKAAFLQRRAALHIEDDGRFPTAQCALEASFMKCDGLEHETFDVLDGVVRCKIDANLCSRVQLEAHHFHGNRNQTLALEYEKKLPEQIHGDARIVPWFH